MVASSCANLGGQTPSTSSETHFLQRCERDGDCGAGLSCLCGACTRTCEAPTTCEALSSSAECVTVASRPADPGCPASAIVAFCDTLCNNDTDCAALGETSRCDRGFCRALSDNCETGVTMGSEVVILGDATIAETRLLPSALEELARASGALAADESYRDYSEPLDNHFGGDTPGLLTQYVTAQDAGQVRVVIMDGGGGDLLTNGCPDPIGSECPTIQDIVVGAERLWGQMAEDGVEHLVYFFYPDPQIDDRLKAMVDTLRPLMEGVCAAATLPCHWLDLRPTFAGKYDQYVEPGELTQTESGAHATAQALWGVMQQECVAQ